MPIIPSAIKAARQAEARRAQRLPYRTNMKTMTRGVKDAVTAGKLDVAATLLPKAFKAIDTAAKKHIIHWKNAARKKSLLSRLVGAKK